jgi:hypothetical protein
MDSGLPIQQKAEKRRTQKDYQGINHNPFTILQKVSNKYLVKIAVHCKIDLGDNEGSIDGIIEILKAKELAQAEILFVGRCLALRLVVEVRGGGGVLFPVCDA